MTLKPAAALAAFCILAGAAAPAPARLPTALAPIAGPDGGWDYPTFDPVKRRLYLARADGVLALDVDTGKVTPHVTDARRGHIALPINGGAELLVTNGQTDTAVIVDAMTGAVRASISTGKKPDAAVFDPATGLVAVMSNDGAGITLIDPGAGKAVGQIPVEGGLEFAVVDGAGRLFVNVEDKNEIVAVDLKTRKVLAHYAMADCDGPTGLAYAPTEQLLVAACANNVATAVSSKTGKLVATLPIGPRPDAALYDARRQRIYVPSGADGQLWVFGLGGRAKITPLGKVATHVGARSLTQDPVSGRIYLPSSDYKAAETPGGRPSMVPGTFAIVVLQP